MPAALLPLSLLARLLHLIPPILDLLPVLLRPPPMAARLSPLALTLPRFVPRLALFASRPLPLLATPSNHPGPPHRPALHRPAACPLALWESTCVRRQARQAGVRLIPLLGESTCVGASRVGVRVFPSKRHPAAPSPRAVPIAPQTSPICAPPCHPSYPRTRVSTPSPHAPQTPPKSTPRPPKSFLEKTLNAREAPNFARFSRSRQQPSTGSVRRLLLPRCVGTGCAVEAAQPRTSADRPWRPTVNQEVPRPELERRAVEAAQPRPLADRPWRRLSCSSART